MLLTDKEEIINTMNTELEGASDSAITWLADTFSVPSQDNAAQKRMKPELAKPVPVEMVSDTKFAFTPNP